MTIPADADQGQSKPEVSISYRLRLATAADAPALSSLISRVWSKHFAYSVSPSDLAHFLNTALSPKQIEADIQADSMRFLVAVTTGPAPATSEEVVGVAQLVLGPTEPCLTLPKPVELRRLYVDDAHHGTGLAKRLVDGVGELAREEGFESIWLGVWEDNVRGMKFYGKMGFETKGEHSFLVGESLRKDWVMEKSLT